MELKHGYKQTEAGVLPVEWEALPAREIGTVRGGSGFPLVAQGETSGDYPFFKVSDMNNEGNETFMTTANHYISEQTRKRLGATAFPAGGIVFAKVGAAVFLERKKILGQRSCIDNNMAAYVLDESRADIRFVHSILLSKKLGALVATTALPSLNGKQFGGMTLAVPPLSEQRAIATALSDTDALLAGLDRLIAKKRDLKQAAMQQLLTGQTRLPGFQGQWESATFGQIAQPRRDRVDPRNSGAQDFCVELEHIAPAGGQLLGHTNAGEQASIKSVFSAGDVLFGKLRAYLRKYWLATRPGVCSTEIWVLAPKSQMTTTEFLFQLVKTDEFIEAASNSYGTHMPRSDWSIVKNLELALPPVVEQTAIATVLSDMDAELSVLEARRDKTRALKQGMMQELLTGRTRLV